VDAWEDPVVDAAKQNTADVLGSQIQAWEQYYKACLDLFFQVHANREEEGGDPITPRTLRSLTDSFTPRTIMDHQAKILCRDMEREFGLVVGDTPTERKNLAAVVIKVARGEKLLDPEQEIFDVFVGRVTPDALSQIRDKAKEVGDLTSLKVPGVETILHDAKDLLSGMSAGKRELRAIGKTAQAEACQQALADGDTKLVAEAMAIGKRVSIGGGSRKVLLSRLFEYS
jgi:hypothetical protein